MTRSFSIFLGSLICIVLAVNVGHAAAEARKSTDNDANLMLNPKFMIDLSGKPVGWTMWSPRPGLSPRATVVDSSHGRALSLEARRFADLAVELRRSNGSLWPEAAAKHWRSR